MGLSEHCALLKTRLYPPADLQYLRQLKIVLALLFLIKAYHPRQLPYAMFTDMALLGQYHCLPTVVESWLYSGSICLFYTMLCHLYSYLIRGYENPVFFNLKRLVNFPSMKMNKMITWPEMEVTEIILAKSRDFVSCRVTVVGFFLGCRFLNR